MSWKHSKAIGYANMSIDEDEYEDNVAKFYVSPEKYQREMDRFQEMVRNVLKIEEELDNKKLANKLTIAELQEVHSNVARLSVELGDKSKLFHKMRVKSEADDGLSNWSDLYTRLPGRNICMPKATTAQFYHYKLNIVKGLKTLYDPISTRPKVADVIEQEPTGLSGLMVPLMKHQKYAIKWLKWRENQTVCGGILADDMGLGKTLTMISLILDKKENNEPSSSTSLKRPNDEPESNDSDVKRPKIEEKVNSTAVASEWNAQLKSIERTVLDISAKYGLLSDNGDNIKNEPKSEYNIDTAFNNFNEMVQKFKAENVKKEIKTETQPKESVSGQSQGNTCNDGSVKQRPSATQSRAENKAGTLVICPASVMHQWNAEVASKVAENWLKVNVYHGPNRREMTFSEFKEIDIHITSYSLLSYEYRNQHRNSWLFKVDWERIILDEGHIIRNTRSVCFDAVCELRGTYHWALTGTPIQNRAKDALALMKFVKVPEFENLSIWNNWLNKDINGHRRLSFVLSPLLLRRTKKELQKKGEMPALPKLNVQLIEVEMSGSEKAVYQIMLSFSRTLFSQFLEQRKNQNADLNYYTSNKKPKFTRDFPNPAYQALYEQFLSSIGCDKNAPIPGIVILVLLLRLRQFCCHPQLVLNMLTGLLSKEELKIMRDEAAEFQTSLGSNIIEELDKYEQASTDEDKKAQEQNIKLAYYDTLKLLTPSNPIFNLKNPSSKMKVIFQTLSEILFNTNDKIIIVSQWTSFLAILRDHIIEDFGLNPLEFNGQVNVQKRKMLIDEFGLPNENRIMLLSLTAGGVGLNLNMANHLLLVDMHWNPQLERQAQDRIYRYGQTKPTFIYRFMVIDSVEQRIKALQDHKLEIANVVLNSGAWSSSRGGLTIEELKNIFDM